MRCKCCDTLLNNYEASRKDKDTGQFRDECARCYASSKAAANELTDDSGIKYDINYAPFEN
jgi:hypothetical protein